MDDRSTGGADLNGPATLTYPALNIGQGDYAPAPSITLTIAGAISAVGQTAVSMNATSLSSAIIMPRLGVIDGSGAFVGSVANYSGTTLTLACPGAVTTESAGASRSFPAAYGKAAPGSAMFPWDFNGTLWSPGWNQAGAYAAGSL